MLEELRIRALGVIEDAVLPLGPGLTVVTGETGAGKTMVVTGLLLLFGGRAESARVRTGAEQAAVEGRLQVSDSAVIARVVGAGGDVDRPDTGSESAPDSVAELVLRRTVSPAGRSRAFVGGASAPVAVLAELAERLVAVHGQADQIRLTRRAEQLGALDRFAGIDTAEYGARYEEWRVAEDRLVERTSQAAQLRREADMLAHGLAEIDSAAPLPGEDDELTALASRLAHADALRLAAQESHDTLAGDPDDLMSDQRSVVDLLGRARHALEQQADADPVIETLAERVAELATLTVDIAAELRDYVDHLDADPARLAQIEERRRVLRDLTRKYGEDSADIAGVLAWAATARVRLQDLDVSDDAIAELTARRDEAAQRVRHMADELSARRRQAAQTLGQAVTGELTGLAMGGAEVTVELSDRSPGPGVVEVAGRQIGLDGADDVEFLLRPHPQSPALPIARGASGGELSRVMLALEVCLAGTDPVPTMVFDEVDAGVGGRAAVEVGRRLARLARRHQVIVVTHLPQVAAFAQRHVVVDKHDGEGGVVASDVRVVTGADRVTELARMLAGTDSAAARRHAAELLADADADDDGSAPPEAGRQQTARSRPARSAAKSRP